MILNILKQQIDNLDKTIDNEVYKLYKLTADEIKIIDKDFKLSKGEYNEYKI